MGESDCCNPRTLSYISASLQLVGVFLMMIIVCLFGLAVASVNIDDTDEHAEEANFFVALGFIFCIIIFVWAIIELAFLITLIVGIKKNSLCCVSAYVYPTLVFLVIVGLFIFYSFIKGFVDGHKVGSVFLSFFYNLLVFGVWILLFAPIFIFHQRLRNPRFQPEHHDLRANQPVHKPQYIA